MNARKAILEPDPWVRLALFFPCGGPKVVGIRAGIGSLSDFGIPQRKQLSQAIRLQNGGEICLLR